MRKVIVTPLFVVGLVGSSLAIQQSCKSRQNDSAVRNTEPARPALTKAEQIEADIKSFDDTQKKLQAANERGAAACDKLDILWDKIVTTTQEEKDMVAPNANPK